MAFTYRCPYEPSVRCDRGNGKGPRSGKCRVCGSALVVTEGTWGVFAWRGDGRYRLVDAVATRATAASADRCASASGSNLVARFIPC